MSKSPSSSSTGLLDLKSFLPSQVQKIFALAESFRQSSQPIFTHGQTAMLMFFEPSTRTRLSFESACHRLGIGPILFDGKHSSSLEKGESIEDSILNAAAMHPAFIILRANDALKMQEVAQQIQVPLINAGWGLKGHPTQALLDLFTISEGIKDPKDIRLLIVGDIKHSRVANSHFELAACLGHQVGICGPLEFLVNRPGVQVFPDLESGFAWANAVLVLRVQFERHDGSVRLSRADYRRSYGVGPEKISYLKKDSVILHPGPINHGVEMESELLKDPRSRVLRQVGNGVLVRQALMKCLLEGDLS